MALFPITRRTKILATLGPASTEEPVLRSLIEAGLDGVRLNFAYGLPDDNALVIERVRRLADEAGRYVAVFQDLAGHKIRIGPLPDSPFFVRPDEEVTLIASNGHRVDGVIPVDYSRLTQDVRAGDSVLLGDGEVELRVKEVSHAAVTCQVLDGGMIKERQGVHFPDTTIVVDSLTDKDISDTKLGLELGVDYISVSFVRTAEDVERIKSIIRDRGYQTPVIAKLERRDAVENLDEIIAAADGVMVARGDLGLQMRLSEVPLLQKRIIREANRAGKIAITATQMMESMVSNPRPTRAEVSDVANAVLDGTDVVMLSGETAIGEYPLATVRSMSRVLERIDREPEKEPVQEWPRHPAQVMALSARQLAAHAGARAIVVFTRQGYSARLLTNQRPTVPVIAFTPSPVIARRMALWRGVVPVITEVPEQPSEMLALTEKLLMEAGFKEGEIIVLARWSSLRSRDWTNFVHLHRLG